MANQWFKFYGSEYLSDPKLLGMDANTRSCWLTLLCYASSSEEPGVVKYLTESHLMVQAGVVMAGEEWKRTEGVLNHFIERKMIAVKDGVITVLNWEKRQETALTNAERQARYRERNEESNEKVTGHVTKVTLEEKRIEENREEREKPHTSLDYLTKLPDSELKELSEKYEASSAAIRRKAEQMANYCRAKGKVYKNYRAFLENGLDKDFGRRAKLQPKPEVPTKILSAEELAKVEAIKREIAVKFRMAV